jgi:hypothetical protein
MLPQLAQQGYAGNPDGYSFVPLGGPGLVTGVRIATDSGWSNQLNGTCAWGLRCSSARSAQETLNTLQRSAPSLDFMRSEAERSGFILRGSFFNETHLPARPH